MDSPTAQQFPQEYLGAKVKKDISDDISDVDVAAKASEDIISQEEIAAEANEEAVVKTFREEFQTAVKDRAE